MNILKVLWEEIMGIDSNTTSVPQFDSLELVKTGTLTATGVANDSNITTLAHNLGYIPILLAFLDNGSINVPLPCWTAMNITAGTRVNFQEWIWASCDKTNLYIQVDRALASTSSYPIRYYLLKERANH